MSLRWDPLLVRCLAGELDSRLAGRRTRALRLDGPGRRLVLLLKDGTLAWSLHPDAGAPLLLPAAETAPGDLALPGRIRRVRALTDERILIVEILPTRNREARDLVVELLGNQWNAMVVERPSATLRHVLIRRDGPRPIRVGIPYQPPAPSAREGGDGPIPLERWQEVLAPLPPGERRRALVRQVAWTSPINAGALVEGDADPETALIRGHALWLRLAFGDIAPVPVVLRLPKGPQPYPWALGDIPCDGWPSLLDALGAVARDTAGTGALGGDSATLPPELLTRLERILDSQLRKTTRLQAELDALDDVQEVRSRADLLLARYGDVPTGATQVTLTDFAGAEVTMSLDPTLTVHENASALYEQAAKSARARKRLPRLLDEALRVAEGWEDLLRRARLGEATADELRASLPRSGTPTAARADAGPLLPYRSYRSSGGLEIRVGRGARFNDDLTFRHSAPGDAWLHARHTAGAHVILRWGKAGNPPARDLDEAAVLAALHSKARTSGSVAVDWTLRKYVRKPRGSAAGSVVPQRVKTLLVRPDPTLLHRLAVDDGG